MIHQGADAYGSDYVFSESVSALASDFDVVVVLDSEGPLRNRLEALGVEVHVHSLGVLRRGALRPLRMLSLLNEWLLAAPFLVKVCREHGVTIVYSNTLAVTVGALVARYLRLPHVWHCHEILTSPRSVARALASLAGNFSDRVVCVSKATEANLWELSRSVRDATVVVHNGVAAASYTRSDVGGLRSSLGISGDELMVLLPGRIHWWKGQDILLEAMAMMTDSVRRRCHVVFAGGVFPGYEYLIDELQTFAASHGLTDTLHMLGYRKDVIDLMSAADVVVVPSTAPDPLPTVVLEAMSVGRPVVAFNQGGAQEMVLDGTTGVLVTETSAEALAAALEALLVDQPLRERMGAAARVRVEAAFSREAYHENIRGLFGSLASARGGSSA